MSASTEKDTQDKAVSRLKTLYEVVKALNASVDLKEAYSRILGVLSQQMGMKRGGFLVMNAESNEWEMNGAQGLSPEEMRRRKEYFGSGVIQRILEKGQMAAVVDGGESVWLYDGRTKSAPKRPSTSFLCAPVKIRGAITGILGVDRFYADPVAVTEDLNLLNEVCALIGEAMLMRKDMTTENRALLEENWSFRKELETLGRSVPKARRRISLTEILEERIARMVAEMKVDPRSNGRLYEDVLNVVERTLLISSLEKTKHVQLKTARFLGINRNTLRRKIKELGITAKEK
ncbi:MAG: helix-turn-helix domain-containing protein [Thermodesulfobacteriota bacterium]|nr:helix-turn-helix domain-containing protein [Thermodesulfobacteriota bacterium]